MAYQKFFGFFNEKFLLFQKNDFEIRSGLNKATGGFYLTVNFVYFSIHINIFLYGSFAYVHFDFHRNSLDGTSFSTL